MATYTVTASPFGGVPFLDHFVEEQLESPRIVGNGTDAPRLEWDGVAGATSYKTFYNGTYLNHAGSARSWTITPTFPGQTKSLGWTYFDGADHWVSPELAVTFSGSPPPPPPPPTSLRIGLVPGGDEAKGRGAAAQLGMGIIRSHDKGVGSSVDAIEAVVRANGAAGMETILLASDVYSNGTGNMAAWAAALGPNGSRNLPVPLRWIEAGNEDAFTYPPKPGPSGGGTYGVRVRDAFNAIKAANPNVGLLCQLGGEGGGSEWIDRLLGAWPGAGALVDGWTIHPYGPPSNGRLSGPMGNYRTRQLTGPVFITEDGMATDGGRCLSDNYGWDPCMDYAEAAAAIEQKVAHVASFPEVRVYLIYKGHDDRSPGATSEREHYFGVYRIDGTAKGPYTAKVIDLVS